MQGTPENWIERIANELRQPMRLSDRFDEQVMAEIRGLPRHRFGTWARALRPRTITISPLISGVAATLLVAAALGVGHAIGARRATRGSDVRADATAERGGSHQSAAGRDVQFVLVAPTARKVSVVGDFNDWDASHKEFQAQHRGGGVWSVTAKVPVGHHRYSFVVDDSVWVADPTAPRVIDDDFGMPNSALVVGGDLAP
jgi:hypothetical protein